MSLLSSGCATTGQTPPADSYCSVYQKIIRAKGDAAISAPLSIKKRIAANEVTYRCLCENWDNALCKSPQAAPK